MGKPLSVLMVEDSERDAQLLLIELEGGGFDVAWQRVESTCRAEMSTFKRPLRCADVPLIVHAEGAIP